MKEITSLNPNKKLNNKNSAEIKLSSSLSTKEVTNHFYSLNKKNSLTSGFKISEKECYDINSIVRNSVEKINDLLNSKEFNNINNNKKVKRPKNELNEKDNEKAKTMKTNFTFNINNFINVPNGQNNKNDSLNLITKKEDRYDDEDDFWNTNEPNFLDNNKKNIKYNINNNNKGNKKINNSNKIKNNFIYNSNRYNNEKIYKNSVRKKKLFEEGININYNNNDINNINIINFGNTHQKKQKLKNNEKEEKDKSITVNTIYKKYFCIIISFLIQKYL